MYFETGESTPEKMFLSLFRNIIVGLCKKSISMTELSTMLVILHHCKVKTVHTLVKDKCR